MYRLRWYRREFTTMGRQRSAGWENKIRSSIMRQYHSPDGAGGCCITSNKSLTCLQLVFTSNWSNFPHAFASRGFVSVSWAFLFNIAYQIGCTQLFVYIPGFLITSWFSPWWFVSDNKRFIYLLFRKPLGVLYSFVRPAWRWQPDSNKKLSYRRQPRSVSAIVRKEFCNCFNSEKSRMMGLCY